MEGNGDAKEDYDGLYRCVRRIAFLTPYDGPSWAQTETIPMEEKVFVEIPEEILVYIPEGTKKTKDKVIFPHKGHKTVDCTVCHHKAYEAMAIKDCSVPGYHSNIKVRTGSDSFYAAFHAKSEENHRSCLDCHKILKKEEKATGPTLCKDCHKKELMGFLNAEGYCFTGRSRMSRPYPESQGFQVRYQA